MRTACFSPQWNIRSHHRGIPIPLHRLRSEVNAIGGSSIDIDTGYDEQGCHRSKSDRALYGARISVESACRENAQCQ